jgi:hypothetical protein
MPASAGNAPRKGPRKKLDDTATNALVVSL